MVADHCVPGKSAPLGGRGMTKMTSKKMSIARTKISTQNLGTFGKRRGGKKEKKVNQIPSPNRRETYLQLGDPAVK